MTKVCRKFRRGFTLVELLVVIGILTVLLALLIPAIQRATYQAKLTTCQARLRQISMAFQVYAQNNNDYMPDLTTPTNGGVNLWDQSVTLYSIFIRDLKFPAIMMFCPLSREDMTDPIHGFWGQTVAGGYYRFGYCFWVPYKTIYGTIPPTPNDGQGYTINGTDRIAGPIKTTDLAGCLNPVATDIVFTYGGAPTPNNQTNLYRSPASVTGLYEYSQHLGPMGTLDSINAVWLDGHAERIAGPMVHPRFLSRNNYWNWR
jgi:prepilin-type N-terminal cleavage/methylation domain-containing protein